MTPEAQRIAIAKACGWTILDTAHGRFCWSEELNKTLPDWDDGMREVPDYLTDLNAMHEAALSLSCPQFSEYGKWLDRIVLKSPTSYPYHSLAEIAHATASQRAEAFLRTLNLWDDTK